MIQSSFFSNKKLNPMWYIDFILKITFEIYYYIWNFNLSN